jgi:hypothetical protein
MARPTLAEQIQKAITDGDLEKAKILADRLATKKTKTKPKKVKNSKKQDTNTNEFIIAARDPHKKQTYIDEEGNEKTRARIVPLDTRKKKNTFKDSGVEYSQDIEFDKKVHANGIHKGSPRPPVKKVHVRCTRCDKDQVLWPGEIMHDNFVCDKCLTSSKPSRR